MDVARFLEWQEINARIGWFINDLERHPFSYYGFALLSRVMLWHPFVVHDVGPVSIRRAFPPGGLDRAPGQGRGARGQDRALVPIPPVCVEDPRMLREAVVVGGGPAGATVAALLARAGETVTLVEREAGPHDKVCGEFISGEAAAYLGRLGLDLAGLGAVRIDRVRLAARGEPSEAALPFPAFSLSPAPARRGAAARWLEPWTQASTLLRGRRVKGLERSRGDL